MRKVIDDYNYHTINGIWFECQPAKPKFSENFEDNEEDLVAEVAPRKDSSDNELSLFRESKNKNLQQNLSGSRTKECSPDKNSNLDISADKAQRQLSQDSFNQKENVTAQKPHRNSMISLKERMAQKKSTRTTDDFHFTFTGNVNNIPQFDYAQLALNQNVVPTLSTQSNITNYINQNNSGFSLEKISAIQAPPGLEPVPERRDSTDEEKVYDSLKNQE